MNYLFAIFIPPLYFIRTKKWGQFIINSFFYGIACLLLLMFLIPFAPFFWLPAMMHAMWNVKKDMRAEQASQIAASVAQKIGKATEESTSKA